MEGCDGACAHQHFCAITCLELSAHTHCVEAPASALAASRSTAQLSAPVVRVYLALNLIILLKLYTFV